MIGSVQGFVSRVKEKNPGHNSSLLSPQRSSGFKNYWDNLKQVLDITVNMVNFIKQRPLKSRMFAKLRENMQKKSRDASPAHRDSMAFER